MGINRSSTVSISNGSHGIYVDPASCLATAKPKTCHLLVLFGFQHNTICMCHHQMSKGNGLLRMTCLSRRKTSQPSKPNNPLQLLQQSMCFAVCKERNQYHVSRLTKDLQRYRTDIPFVQIHWASQQPGVKHSCISPGNFMINIMFFYFHWIMRWSSGSTLLPNFVFKLLDLSAPLASKLA